MDSISYFAVVDDERHALQSKVLSEAIAEAESIARQACRTSLKTEFAHAVLFWSDEGEPEYRWRKNLTVTVDPDEPYCADDEPHDWQAPVEIVGGCEESPGVYGSGGGVTLARCCMMCGCKKLVDTWATDPETGEQGFTTVTYSPGYYLDRLDDLLRTRRL